MGFNECVSGEGESPVKRRFLSLSLFVVGYLTMASLAPMTALVPALLSFFAGVFVLIREPEAEVAPARDR